MNSKVIGAMLILGPILLVGPWMLLDVNTSDMGPAEHLAAILAESTKIEIRSILNVFGGMSMFIGLYFLARSLKSNDTVSNTCSEIGGLLLLVGLPLWATIMGSDIMAIEAAEEFGNDAGETIIAASTMLQMAGMFLVIGLLLLGISLALLKKYKGIVGILFVITSGLAFLDMVQLLDNDIVEMSGWMGMFLMILVTGILTTLQKEKQT